MDSTSRSKVVSAVVFFSIFTLKLCAEEIKADGAYGENCRATEPQCNEEAFLWCYPVTEKCRCYDTTELYDHEDAMCKIKVGRICNSVGDPKAMLCVKNSTCDPDTETCTCIGDSIPGPSGEGICLREYGAPCGTDTDSVTYPGDCDVARHQKCIANRCSCTNPDDMVYSEKDKTCFIKMNSTCTIGSLAPTCQSSFVCGKTSGKCECDSLDGLVYDGYDACVKKLGTSCNYYESPNYGRCDVKEDLICETQNEPNICRCNPDITTQIGAGEEARCVRKFGVACNTQEIPEGRCKTEDYLTCRESTCQCDSRHVEKDDGYSKHCVGNLNSPCRSDYNCNRDDGAGLECNMMVGKCEYENNGGGQESIVNWAAICTFTFVALNLK